MAEQEENILQMRSHLIPKTPSNEQRYCHHSHITVVEEMRLLLCNDCQLWIEPFEYLLGWARKDWAAAQIANQHRKEVQQLCKDKAKLKREERNIKARLRRLKSKLIIYEQALKGDK